MIKKKKKYIYIIRWESHDYKANRWDEYIEQKHKETSIACKTNERDEYFAQLI